MGVSIKIDLDAKRAEEKIGRIAASLGGLEQVADRTDIDFDTDVDGISGEIQDLRESLIELGSELDDINRKMDTLDQVDGAEFEVTQKIKTEEPDGRTGSGDSTGGDPPGSAGGSRNDLASILRRRSGDLEASDILGESVKDMTNTDIKNIQTTLDSFWEQSPVTRRSKGGDYPPSFLLNHISDPEVPGDSFISPDLDELGPRTSPDVRPVNALASGGPVHTRRRLRKARDISGRSKRSYLDTPAGMPNTVVSMMERRDVAGLPRITEGKFTRGLHESPSMSVSEIPELLQFMRHSDPEGDVGGAYEEFKQGKFDMRMSHLTSDETSEVLSPASRFNPPEAGDGKFIGELEEKIAQQRSDFERRVINTMAKRELSGRGVQQDVFEGSGAQLMGRDHVGDRPDSIGLNNNIRAPETRRELLQSERTTSAATKKFWENLRSDDDDSGDSKLSFDPDAPLGKKLRKARKPRDGINIIENINKRLGKVVSKAFPSFRAIRTVISGLLPVLAAMATSLLGVAAAMGAVAVAGGAILGLGLLGHGEDMSSSFDKAGDKVGELAEELFNVSQPTLSIFGDIQERMFDAIPARVGEISNALAGLAEFEGTLFQLGGMLSEGLVNSLDAIEANEAAISQLALRFSSVVGSGVANFFGFIFQEARENQDLFLDLASDLKNLAISGYVVATSISTVISTFSPLTEIILIMAKLLENDFIAAIAATAGWLFVLGKAAIGISVVVGALQGFVAWAGKAYLSTLIFESSLWSAATAAGVLVATLGALTFGAIAIGGFISSEMAATDIPTQPNSVGAGGGGTVNNYYNDTTINHNGGDGSLAETEELKRVVERSNETTAAQHRLGGSISRDESDT